MLRSLSDDVSTEVILRCLGSKDGGPERNAGRAYVDRGIRSDHSGVVVQDPQGSRRPPWFKIAGQIEVDVGAAEDVPTATSAAVEDPRTKPGIKAAPG